MGSCPPARASHVNPSGGHLGRALAGGQVQADAGPDSINSRHKASGQSPESYGFAPPDEADNHTRASTGFSGLPDDTGLADAAIADDRTTFFDDHRPATGLNGHHI